MRATILRLTVLLSCCLAVAVPVHAHDDRLGLAVSLPGASLDADAGDVSTTAACSGPARATADRPDSRSGSQVHLVYLVPADQDDTALDTSGAIECAIRAQNEWMVQQSGLRWIFDTFSAGGSELVDVTFVRSTRNAAALNSGSEVRAELMNLGFNEANKRYLSYVESDGGGACGDALYPLNVGTAPVDGKFSQVYLRAPAGCRSRDLGSPGAPGWSDTTAQQEMMHNDGIVPIGAPHGCGPFPLPFGHVCTPGLWAAEFVGIGLDPERVDVMYPFINGPLSTHVLDRGRDDYFRHANPLLRDLQRSPFLEQSS